MISMHAVRLKCPTALVLFLFLFFIPPLVAQQTLIPAESSWRWRKGTNEVSTPPALWRTDTFNDVSWPAANAPFQYGYAGGTVLADMRDNYTSVFLRRSFMVTNRVTVQSLALSVNYDDGFVAWINGREVARALVTGDPAYDHVATGNHAATPAQTFNPSLSPQLYLVEGINVIAVHAFNRDISSSTDFYFDASLQVTRTAGVPANDSFANRVVVPFPAPWTVTGSNTNATRQTGEPRILSNSSTHGGKSVWWSWTAPTSGTATLTTGGSNFDTILGVFTGTSVSGLTRLVSNDDGPGLGVQSLVTFSVSQGTTYQFVVDGYGSNTSAAAGGIVLNLSGTFTDPTPPEIAGQTPSPGAALGALTAITVTFSKGVIGVDASDLLINGIPAAGLVGAPGSASYTFTFTQPLPGPVDVSWDEIHDIADVSGNPFDAAAPGGQWGYTLADTVAPGVGELTPAAGAQVSRMTRVEVTFTEPVFGVVASDLLVNGQPAQEVTGFGAGPYVFEFAEPVAGTVQFAWAADHTITDAAETPNRFAGGTWVVTLDPGVSLGDVVINEFLAGNLTGLADEDGDREDWIEIYNRGTSTVNLLGWSLTDNARAPGQWVFPSTNLAPGQYLVVFASAKDRRSPGSRLHTNFKLDLFGEYLALYNAESPRVAVSEFAPRFPEQRNSFSYGPDSSGVLRYFPNPTPGAPNGSSPLTGVALQPNFSVSRGIFDAPFNLVLTAEAPGAVIAYTTDGSQPTFSTGAHYSAPLRITNSATIRAVTFAPGQLPSRVRTHTYIFPDEVLSQPNNPSGFPTTWGVRSGYGFPGNLVPADYEMDMAPLRINPLDAQSPVDPAKLQRLREGLRELPIVSIVMNTEDMFGSSGIYHASNVMNKNFADKACSVEMILVDGSTAFAETCGIRIHGNASRQPEKNPKHGFKLKFKSEFGDSSLKYRLFPESASEDYDDLILRADFGVSWLHWSDVMGEANGSMQRTRAIRFRDAWLKESARDMGVVASHNRFCHLFINGLYWGTYDISEQPKGRFGAGLMGGTHEDYDVYEQGNGTAGYVEGTPPGGSAATYNVYQKLLALPQANSISGYEAFKEYLDVTEYIDYTFLHFYAGHRDWGTTKNWYAIRQRAGGTFTTEGKFKFAPWDGECVLLNADNSDNRIPGSGGSNNNNSQSTPGDLHAKLAVNAQYRLDFADRVHKHMIALDGALTADANISRWLKWSNILDKAIVAESARWGDYRRDVHPYQVGDLTQLYTREDQWMTEHNRIVGSYLPGRRASVLGWLRSAGLYPAMDAPEYREGATAGPVTAGGRVAAGYLLAMRNPGAGTIHYTTNGTDPRVYYLGGTSAAAQTYTSPIALNASVVVKARVLNNGNWSALNEATFAVGELGVPLRITEIMYNPPGGDAYEFIEMQNIGLIPLDVSGFTLQGISYVFPAGTVIPPGGVVLLASSANIAAFSARYPGVSVFGTFGGSLSNGGERIAIRDASGVTVTAVHYDDEGGWPLAADGGGYSIEVIDPRGDPSAPANWRAGTINGTPGVISTPPSAGDVVINEVMADNKGSVTNGGTFPDWVELHNRGSNSVSLDNWSLSDDSNPRKYVFPSGTSIPAGGYLVIWCDSDAAAPGLHAGFALAKDGENVFLYNQATHRVDGITFGLQLTDFTVGRIEGEWQLTEPTPGAANIAVNLAPSPDLALNEWMAGPAGGGSDWVELFNRSETAPAALRGIYLGAGSAIFRITSLSFLPPRGHAQLFADEQSGASHLDLRFPSGGGPLILFNEAGVELERVVLGGQPLGVAQGRLPDGTAEIATFAGSASPGSSNYVLTYTGPVINEVLARNQRATVSPWNDYPDWVEIFNPGDAPVDMGGMALGRSAAASGRWMFPSGTTIPAGGYLMVWCSGSRPASVPGDPVFNTGFSLPGESGDLCLFDAGGQPVDWVIYGFQISDASIGRVAGEWRLMAAPTPGAANASAAALGPPGNLRVNEWMASPLTGGDWFEIYNAGPLPVDMGGLYLTDDPSITGRTNHQVAALSFVDGYKWVVFLADGDVAAGGDHVSFSLSKQGETLRIYRSDLVLVDAVDFGVQADGVSEGRLPDGAAAIVSFAETPTPGTANYLPLATVVINEVLSHSDVPLEDAVELHNLSDSPVSIGGWYLSDSLSDPKRYRIPDGTVIPAGGYAVFYQHQFGPADGEADVPPLFSFNSAHGDAAYLSQADASGNLSGFRAGAVFGSAANGVSFGRYSTSVGVDFVAMSARTFGMDDPGTVAQFRTGAGLPNAYPLVGPVVINELMYHPSAGAGALENPEYIELHNISGTAVPLFDPANPSNGWRLENAITFSFASETIPAGGYLLVVPFNPEDAAALAAFRSRYGGTTPVVGPYSGRLDNSGETVELYRPDAPQGPSRPDAGFVPYILADRVAYSNLAPWPEGAAGGGASLQRIASSEYGNDPVNWTADVPTAGSPNSWVSGEQPMLVAPEILSSGAFSATLIAPAGRTYAIEFTTDFEAWLESLRIVVSEPQTPFVDTEAADAAARFYRVRLIP